MNSLEQALRELVSTVTAYGTHTQDERRHESGGERSARSPLSAVKSVCTITKELMDEDLPYASTLLFSTKKETHKAHDYQHGHQLTAGAARQVHTEGLLGFLDQGLSFGSTVTPSKTWIAEFSKAKEEVVTLIREVVKHIGKDLESYCECVSDIKNTLFRLLKHDSNGTSALNVACIRGLNTLYKLQFAALTNADRTEVEEMINFMLTKFNSSKSSQTVKGWSLKFACLLCYMFSNVGLRGRSEYILQTILSSLDSQFRSKKPDMQIIDGALSGLCTLSRINKGDLLKGDSHSDKRVQLLYKYMCISLEPIKEMQRYDIPRAGLRILRTHAGLLLSRYLTEDAERMFRRLFPICTHVNNKLRHKALIGLDSFLEAICRELLSGARTPESDKRTFLYLINELFKMLESPDSSSRDIAMGIRGLGRLAAAMKLFFDDDYIRTRLDGLYLFAERLLPGGSQAEEDALLHAARFVGSYAAIAAQLSSIDETRISQMERLVCTLFKTYPDLHMSQKPGHHLALLQMFCAASGKGNALQSLLTRFMVQGLFMTCSESVTGTGDASGIIGELSQERAGPDQIPLYVEYIPLWKSLLEPSDYDKRIAGTLLGTKGKSHNEEMNELCKTVYDVFVQGVLDTMQKLDLTYTIRRDSQEPQGILLKKERDEDEKLVDEVIAAPGMYAPHSPREMETFLNLVEFLKMLLPDTPANMFSRWAFVFGREVISHSTRLPLVSGFYRLLTVSLRLCEKSGYFIGTDRLTESNLSNSASRNESFISMECELGANEHANERNQRVLCKELYSRFLHEVSMRLQQYQDELLCACLELILEAPCQLLAPFQIVRPLIQAFELGTSYLPIAMTALRSLRRWLDYEEDCLGEYDNIKSFLPRILPSLDPYLLIPAKAAAEDKGDKLQSSLQNRWSKGKQRQNKYLQLARNTNVTLEEVQEAIVLLLGSLGDLCGCVVGKVDLGDEKRLRGPAIVWDPEKKIELKLGFGADRVTMLLDSLFPRVLILAESSSNRQTKIAACELLHSVLLLVIGLEANSQGTNMTRYYEKALPVVLRLATDTEVVARQLFEPLIVQIIHWFTSPAETRRQKYSQNAGYLLEALTENVCARGQSALRDLCARCIGEYVAWAIKHTPPEQSRSPKSLAGVQIRLLLDRAFTLSRLYDPAKRLGAAITLQKIIVPLREDQGLASLFTLEIAHHALFSLRLAHGSGTKECNDFNSDIVDEGEEGELLAAGMQMSHVVRSLCRVVKHYAQCFIEASKLRCVHQSLEEFLMWVLESALTRHEALHHALCLEVLDELVPLLPSTKGNLERWDLFKTAVSDGSFEKEVELIRDVPCSKLNSTQLDVLTSALVSYTWASSYGLQQSVPGEGALSVRIEGLIASVLEEEGESTGKEPQQAKREAVKALFDYFTAYNKKGIHINRLISNSAVPGFLNLLLRCILLPSTVLCRTSESAKSRAFHKSLIEYGRLLCDSSSRDKLLYEAAQKTLRGLLEEPRFNLMRTDFTFSSDSFRPELTQELCTGYSDLYGIGLLSPSEGSGIGKCILTNLFKSCGQYNSPAKVVLANALFGLALNLSGESGSLVRILTSGDSDSVRAFYSTFKARIVAHTLNEKNFRHLCPLVMNAMERSETLWTLFAGLLSRRGNTQSDREVVKAEDLVATVLGNTVTLERWSSDASPVELRERTLEVLELLARMHQETFNRFCDRAVFRILSSLLGASSKALKIRALGLLRYLSLEGISKLRGKVHDIVTYDFPMRSSDLRPGSTACNEYLAMLDELLRGLEVTGSPDLLEELYPVIREKDHIHKRAIAETFYRIEEDVPGEQQLELAKVALSGSTERGYPQDLKDALINKVAIPLLERIPQKYLVELLCQRIASTVKTVALGVEHGHPVPQERQHALFDRIHAFALLRAAYERLTPEIIRTELNNAYIASTRNTTQPPKGNELTQAVMRAAHTARSERVITDGEWVSEELVLRYHCFAYAALAAVVICTQSKEAFYTTLFFKEHPEKNDLIWTNIIDLNKTFVFDVETNFPVATRAFRSLQATGNSGTTGELARKRRKTDAVHYISTQYLQDSTFSQDLSYMGSFVPQAVSSTSVSPSSTMIGGETDMSEKVTSEQRREGTTEMEMDEVNKSLLMIPFMRLLDAIASKFPLKADEEVPDWEDELLSKFKDERTHINIRIFIAKCLLNRPQMFTVHSQYWIRPVLKFALALPQTQGISYFLRDICVLVLRWLKDKENLNIQIDVTTSERNSNLVSQFINNLMKCAIYSKRTILKSNIEIIKLFVEQWRSGYVPDKALIYDMLRSGQDRNIGKGDVSARITGLQLLGIIIANGFPFFDPEHDVSSKLPSESQLSEVLVENLSSSSKDVRNAAAEVIGLILKSKVPTVTENDDDVVMGASYDMGSSSSSTLDSSQTVSTLSTQTQETQEYQKPRNQPRGQLEVLVELKIGGMFTCDIALALTCLFKIGTHCPSYMTHFISHIFNVLPKLNGELRAMALEMIKWVLPDIDELPKRLRLSGAETLLRYRDNDSQRFLLEIYKDALKYLGQGDINRIVGILCDVFPAHPSQECRELYYEVLMTLYDKDISRDSVRGPLLVGLADKSPQIRDKLLDFWASEERLGGTPDERLVMVMKQCFTPEIESAWLGIATILLLRLCTNSEQKVFDRPLSNCAFRDIDISSNTLLLRRAASIFTPMFSVSSLIPQQSALTGTSSLLWGENNGFVRATQDAVFTPTQVGGMDIEGTDSGYDDSQSSRYKTTLLFNYQSDEKRIVSQKRKRDEPDTQQNSQQQPQPQYALVKRRFNPVVATQDIIASVLRRKRMKDIRTASIESGKAASVVMMRKYREGELPDIEIKPTDILKPLSVLVQHDQVIARYAFYELANHILRATSDNSMLSEISGSVLSILGGSHCTDPNFVSVMHDILGTTMVKSGGAITIPPQAVSLSAERSGALHTGILLLENVISALTAAQKQHEWDRKGGDPQREICEQCWSHLAQLYLKTGESDVAKGIYEKNFSKQPQTVRALEYELTGRYDKALEEFDGALRILDSNGPWPGNMNPTLSECDLWENGRLECMSKLLQWGSLSDNVLAEVSPGYNGDGELPHVSTLRKLFDEKYNGVYLDHFFKSQLRMKERWGYLRDFVSDNYSNADGDTAAAQKRRRLLEDRFGPDITLLTIANGDLDNARHLLEMNISGFVGSWARLHPLAVEARRSSLSVLQRIAEASELLEACRGDLTKDPVSLQGMIDRWHARTPLIPDISAWDDITSARSVYFERLSDRCADNARKSYFVREKSNILHSMAEAAKRFGNLAVSDACLRMALKLNPEKRDNDFRLIMTSVDLFILKGESRDGNGKAERYSKALKFVLSKEGLPVIQADVTNQRKFSSATGGLYAKLVGILAAAPNHGSSASTTISDILGLNNDANLINVLTEKAIGYLESSIYDVSTLSNKEYDELLLKYSLYCNEFLRVKQNNPGAMPGISLESLYERTTIALIQAMKHGSLDAISRVPRLLSLLSMSPSARAAFSAAFSRGEIPVWIFVPWVSQMVGSLDLAEGEAITPVLAEIAREYPQAVFYPLNVSSRKAQAQARRLSARIWNILDSSCSLLRSFVRACELSVHPEHRAKDAITEIKALKQEGKTPEIELRRALQELARDCFDDTDPSSGNYNLEKAREWRVQLRKEKMTFSQDILPPISWVDRIAQIVTSDRKPERPTAIQAYSRWMATYHAMNNNDGGGSTYLEVPGQYNKLGVRPAPERHSMVTSFESNVLVMSSLRCPKRIGIVTNDGGIKYFLLKGGEDLRLDERIEQTFTLTNGFLANSDRSRRGLEISTYSVVPLSYRSGIIEWVQGTETFKSLVTKQFIKTKSGKDFTLIARKHMKWVETYAKMSSLYSKSGDKLAACIAYDTATRKDAVKELESEHAMVPEGLMRRAILDMSFSPEAFICIRHEFARSLSALSITSYILGIGDRHMDNFLLNSANGRVVGIDFGHAFGTATQFLYIPELMPFGLTRQLVGVLAPHGYDGILKHDMIETLQVLENNKDLLLDVLAIFVKEPLIAWDSYLQKIKHSVLEELNVPDVDIKQWYVKEKLALVEKKLSMGNPAYITARELKHSTVSTMGFSKRCGLVDKIVQVAKGDERYNVRANVGEYCSSVTEQVNCLIDQATDPHILAKTFIGWAPYL